MNVDQIKFISALNCKPVQPPYLRLYSLKDYRKINREKNQAQMSGQQEELKKSGSVNSIKA